MIGVLVVTHGEIGRALLAGAAQILGGEPPQAAALGMSYEDDPDQVLARARALVKELDRGDGVIVLSDIFGATPCNLCTRLLADGRVEGISGVSLPMLLRVLTGRTGKLADAVRRALSGGAEGVVHLNTDRCCGA